MSAFRNVPYTVVSSEPEGGLWLRRYHVVTALEGIDFPFVMAVSRHFATYTAAAARLPDALAEYPSASVASVLLAFDPEDPEQLAAYERMRGESGSERREAMQ